MKLIRLSLAAASCITATYAFIAPTQIKAQKVKTTLSMSNSNRRVFLTNASAAFGAAALVAAAPDNVHAISGVTVAEFETILKTAAKSVKIVELSGPKSETALITLIDGTQFIISDLYESPTDPRSPLKLIATCRSYNVPTKSVGLEDALSALSSSGSKKKKVYMNKRVQEAAEKERERKERMEQDEIERLAELEKMNESM